MAKERLTIFITGGTGYIGGSFLHLMLTRGYLEDFAIRALVRRPDDARRMQELGVEPVLGTLDDNELLAQTSADSDIVFNTANCDHQPSARAIVQGLQQRAERGGTRPILIHTSGAGVLSTNSTGRGESPEKDAGASLWDDTDARAHAAIPPYAPHRMVDLEVFAAADVGDISTYLVVPPTVFGQGLGPFAQDRMSIQLPRLVYESLASRRALYVGAGEAMWTNVHVADIADLYLRILAGALDRSAPEGRDGLYYPTSEYFTWKDVAAQIGKTLFERGLIEDPNPSSGLPRGWFWGSNVRTSTPNSAALGWQPTHGGTTAMLQDLDWDTELVLRMLKR